MAALTKDAPRTYKHLGFQGRAVVQASQTIFQGAALTANAAGEVAPHPGSGVFYGFAQEPCTTAAGVTDKRIPVVHDGVVQLTVTGVSAIGADVHALDDGTFANTGGVVIGKTFRQVNGTLWEVAFNSSGQQ